MAFYSFSKAVILVSMLCQCGIHFVVPYLPYPEHNRTTPTDNGDCLRAMINGTTCILVTLVIFRSHMPTDFWLIIVRTLDTYRCVCRIHRTGVQRKVAGTIWNP